MNSHWCLALRLGIQQAIDTVESRSVRHGGQTPGGVFTFNCYSFARRDMGSEPFDY
jgi:hypothetical protein